MTQVFPLIQRDLSFTPYSIQWVPSSARLCAVGATTRGAGIISVYRVNGKRLEIANEVVSQCRQPPPHHKQLTLCIH